MGVQGLLVLIDNLKLNKAHKYTLTHATTHHMLSAMSFWQILVQ